MILRQLANVVAVHVEGTKTRLLLYKLKKLLPITEGVGRRQDIRLGVCVAHEDGYDAGIVILPSAAVHRRIAVHLQRDRGEVVFGKQIPLDVLNWDLDTDRNKKRRM